MQRAQEAWGRPNQNICETRPNVQMNTVRHTGRCNALCRLPPPQRQSSDPSKSFFTTVPYKHAVQKLISSRRSNFEGTLGARLLSKFVLFFRSFCTWWQDQGWAKLCTAGSLSLHLFCSLFCRLQAIYPNSSTWAIDMGHPEWRCMYPAPSWVGCSCAEARGKTLYPKCCERTAHKVRM